MPSRVKLGENQEEPALPDGWKVSRWGEWKVNAKVLDQAVARVKRLDAENRKLLITGHAKAPKAPRHR